MRIAIDTNCILPGRVGGIENYTIALVEALCGPHSPATDLVILTRPENHDLFGRFTSARAAVVRIDRPLHAGKPVDHWATLLAAHPESGRRALETFQRRKADMIRQLGVDLVHFPGNTINPLELNLPAVLNLHDLQHRHYPQYFSDAERQNRETWWRKSAERADALIAASDYVKRDLGKQWNISASRVFVTPDPVESAFAVTPTAERLAAVVRRFDLTGPFFLYPAAAWPHKNHESLLRAFASAGLSGVRLLLTGGGQDESLIPGMIASMNLADRVRLLGRVETADLVCLYRLATAMIFPSRHESWSIPVAEAMTAGCPVACSNVTSLPEEVGDAGLLFNPDDTPAMAHAMRRLATDAELRTALAHKGRSRVARFTTNAFAGVLAHAYAHAINAHRARKAAA